MMSSWWVELTGGFSSKLVTRGKVRHLTKRVPFFPFFQFFFPIKTLMR